MAWTPEEEDAVHRLAALHRRINEIADMEARSALVKGWAAQGHLMPEKMRLIDESERILDELLGNSGRA